MLPLLGPGDRIFVDESGNTRLNLHDGDVIVLRHKGTVIVKRILAMQGETISGDRGKVFRDGKQLDEPYVARVNGQEIGGPMTFPPRRMGTGEVFVMGDNRGFSLDSRFVEYGTVYSSDVIGKYAWTYWHAK